MTRIERLTEFIRREWREVVANATRPPAPAQQSPVDEAALIERATAGVAARAFLDSETFLTFMARAEANLTNAMLTLPLEADAGRRDLAVAIQTQRQWMRYLAALAGEGAHAERELERLRSGRRDFF